MLHISSVRLPRTYHQGQIVRPQVNASRDYNTFYISDFTGSSQAAAAARTRRGCGPRWLPNRWFQFSPAIMEQLLMSAHLQRDQLAELWRLCHGRRDGAHRTYE